MVIERLYQRGYLTVAQFEAYSRWLSDPTGHVLPGPILFILLQFSQPGAATEAIERRNGWPPRSAKVMIRLCLDVLLEPEAKTTKRVRIVENNDVSSMRAEVAYLRAQEPQDWIELGIAYGLTKMQARTLVIMQRAGNRVLSKAKILEILYDASSDAIPDVKVIDVYVCHLRRKLAGSPLSIRTVWGVGYQLVDSTQT